VNYPFSFYRRPTIGRLLLTDVHLVAAQRHRVNGMQVRGILRHSPRPRACDQAACMHLLEDCVPSAALVTPRLARRWLLVVQVAGWLGWNMGWSLGYQGMRGGQVDERFPRNLGLLGCQRSERNFVLGGWLESRSIIVVDGDSRVPELLHQHSITQKDCTPVLDVRLPRHSRDTRRYCCNGIRMSEPAA
jgi:hypothetical protein